MPQNIYEIEDPDTGDIYEIEADAMPSAGRVRSLLSQLRGPRDDGRRNLRAEDFMPAQSTEHPHARAARWAGEAVSGAWDMLNPVTMVQGIAGAVRDLPGTGRALVGAQVDQARKAAERVREGRYNEAAAHAGAAILPVVGPIAADIGERIGEGDVAGGVGAAAGLIGGPAALKGAARGVKAGARAARRAVASTATPEVADAVKWALEQGIPVDAATATGNRVVQRTKAAADASIGGGFVGDKAANARAEAMARTGRGLADRAAPVAATPETAGAAVREGIEGVIRQHADEADTFYGRVRAAERVAQPDDVPVSRAVAGATSVDDGFFGHWLADDLAEQGYQKGGTTLKTRNLAEKLRGVDDEAAHALRFNAGAAGTKVLGMFHDAGVSGSAAEVADKVRRVLRGESTNPRVKAVIGAMREAWDGQRFDFDLVSDEALAATGLKRRQMQSPRGLPNLDTPGASRFFGDEAAGRAASGTEPMQFAVDVRGAKDALRPVLERLEAKRSAAGILMDPKDASALASLRSIVGGADHLPLTTVDAALGEIKGLARGAALPELRSSGQGVAAAAVKQLEDALQAKAKAVGVWDDLQAGRQATIAKWSAAETLDKLKAEPVQTFRSLTQAGDAAVEKLRDVKKIAPAELPKIGRGYLEGLMDTATSEGGFGRQAKLWAEWDKLGAETKALIFPDADLRGALDKFFLVGKKMAENPNPSGTALTLIPYGQGGLLFTEPISGVASVLSGAAVSKLLNSPKTARLLTEGLQTRRTAPAARSLTARLKTAIRTAGKGAYPTGIAAGQGRPVESTP